MTPRRHPTLLHLSPPVAANAAADDLFESLTPARIVDTRPGRRTVDQEHAGHGKFVNSYDVRINGRGGVPAACVGAVILNVTATEPNGAGHLTVYPAGTSRPTASNVNYSAGQTVANAVVSEVSTDGWITISSSVSTHMIVDVTGWIPSDSDFQPVTPFRLTDTRPGRTTGDMTDAGTGRFFGDHVVQVANQAGIPTSQVGSVVLNVTAVNPSAAGYLTVYPNGESRPETSNLNFLPGQAVPNLAIMKVGSRGTVRVYSSATTDLIVDVVGWLPSSSDFRGLSPARLVDTRPGWNRSTSDGAYRGDGSLSGEDSIQIAGRAGVPNSGAGAVVLNVTVLNARSNSYTTVYPAGASLPNASNVNHNVRQPVANTVVAKLGPTGAISIFNNTGADLIIDITGWIPWSTPPAPMSTNNEFRASLRAVASWSFGRLSQTEVAIQSDHVFRLTVKNTAPDHLGQWVFFDGVWNFLDEYYWQLPITDIESVDVTGDGYPDFIIETWTGNRWGVELISANPGTWTLLQFIYPGGSSTAYILGGHEVIGGRLTTHERSCVPSCATGGHLTYHWRYDAVRQAMVSP